MLYKYRQHKRCADWRKEHLELKIDTQGITQYWTNFSQQAEEVAFIS